MIVFAVHIEGVGKFLEGDLRTEIVVLYYCLLVKTC